MFSPVKNYAGPPKIEIDTLPLGQTNVDYSSVSIDEIKFENRVHEVMVSKVFNQIVLMRGGGRASDLATLQRLLFANDEPGGIWIPTLSPSMISANTLGSGVETLLDLQYSNNATQATPANRPAWMRVPEGGRRNILVVTNTMATQSRTVAAAEHTLSFRGTGTVTLTGASTAGPLVGTGANDIVSLTFTPTAGSLTLTVSGTVNDAQLELGAVRTGYQNVASVFDITESGKRSIYGLWADGTDDGMATPSIDFSTTNKVTVFWSGRTITSASSAALVELSTNPFTTNGTFGILAPASSNNYRMRSRGTDLSDATASGFAAPDNAILTGQADISANTNRLRRNGTQIASSSSDQGTGNYKNDLLYLFRRGGTTAPFNGQTFALIVAGGNYSTSTIEKVEKILAKYTPGVTL
jgi:hypothetical protein